MRRLYLLALLFFVVSVAAVPPNQVHLSTTSDPSNSAVVTWQTYESSPTSVIEYSTTASLAGAEVNGALEYRFEGYEYYMHNATLSALVPNAVYYYRVGDGAHWSETFSFRTAPPLGSETTFTAVAWGDQGHGNTAVPLAAASINPQLVLIPGDLAYSGDPERVDEYFDAIQPIASKALFMAAPGNHEYSEFGPGSDNLTHYVQRFAFPANPSYSYLNERTYSINYGNAHFAFLDLGRSAGDDEDQVNSEDVKAWLDADLAAVPSTITWKVVIFHFNLYSSSSEHPMTDAQRERRRFEPVFRSREVDLVIQAHVHNYERTYPLADPDVATNYDPSNVVFETDYVNPSYPVYLVAGVGGNCCYDLGSSPAWSAVNLEETGYVKLIFSNNTLTEEFRSTSHALRDTFTITKGGGSVSPPLPLAPDGNGTNASVGFNSSVDFSLSVQGSLSLVQGNAATVYLTGTQVQGSQATATISVLCPVQLQCTPGASASAFNFSIPLSFSSLPSTPIGSYSVDVNVTSGNLSRIASVLVSVVFPSSCSENWQCGDWSQCSGNAQTRVCTDVNNCGTNNSRPTLSITCGECTALWQCTALTACFDGFQTRTCTDMNQCNEDNGNKPQEDFLCGSAPANLPLEPSVTQGSPVVAQTAGENGSLLNSLMASIVSFFSWVSNLLT